MKYREVIFIFLLLLSLGSAQLNATELDSLSYNWGTLYFDSGQSKLARTSGKEISRSINRMNEWLGFTSSRHFSVIIATQQETYKQYAGHLPEWATGSANYHNQQIVVKSPSLGKSDLRNFNETLQHEVAHMVLGQNINPDRLPRWLNEGIAMAVTNEYSLKHMYNMAQAAVRNDLIPLKDIEQLNYYEKNRALLGYAESYSAVRYIQSEFPTRTLPDVLTYMQVNDISYEQAFQKIAGVSQFYFEWHWQKHVKSQYNWLTMLSSDTFIWILFPALALLAYLTLRWRNKKKLDKWEDEESRADEGTEWDYEYMPDEDEDWKGDIH